MIFKWYPALYVGISTLNALSMNTLNNVKHRGAVSFVGKMSLKIKWSCISSSAKPSPSKKLRICFANIVRKKYLQILRRNTTLNAL